MRTPFIFLIPLVCLAICAHALDQTGAELRKKPVAAEITHKDSRAYSVGNVIVTYEDGTKDVWTKGSNSSLPRVAADGTVGWTVSGPENQAVTGSSRVRNNPDLVLCRKGRIIAKARSSLEFIEDWTFISNGEQFALRTRALHGPAQIELHETSTGKLIQCLSATAADLPVWAQPLEDK